MTFRLYLLKRSVEDVFIFPFVLLGRLLSRLRPLEREYRIFFFFPFYHTGGAEKVHSLIAQATGGEDCIIFFTRKSVNDAFLQDFCTSGCTLRDVSRFTDNKWLYFLNLVYRGIASGYINRQKKAPVVFNGQSNFGYKLTPWVKKGVRQIELIHSVSNFSYIRMPFLPFIETTVMISREKIAEHLEIYRKRHVPPAYADRIRYIPNASVFENFSVAEKDFGRLQVLYSGRMSPEKRVPLLVRIAEAVHRQDSSIRFVFAGDSFSTLDKANLPFIDFAGNISDPQQLARVYKASHVLCLASSTEGFPLAVIEAMAYGCAVVSTPVGDLPAHVQNSRNGFLFSTTDEEKIVEEGAAAILRLKNDPALLQAIAAENICYAAANFSFARFAADYQKLLSA